MENKYKIILIIKLFIINLCTYMKKIILNIDNWHTKITNYK